MRNLNILQSGGGVFYSSVANPYSNAAAADLQAAASSKSSSKDDGLIPKALMEKLSEKGIPVDVDKFAGMLADFERQSSFGMGVNKRALYQLLAYANRVIKLSEYLDAAEKRAEQNGALDEFAVDSRGYLYVPSEDGKILKVHASLFDASKLTALTVGELLQLRKFNPNEVDNESIATTVGNNIGIEKINDYILGIIKAVGSTDEASEAYTNLSSILGKEAGKKQLSQELMQAFKDLYLLTQLLGPDAIFKVKDQYKSKNMEAAMSYIMSVLPNNIKTQLIARNVAAGGKYENSTRYAADIIGMAAMAGNDVKVALGIDYDASINKAAGTSAESESNKSYYTSPMEVFWDGDLGKAESITISDPSNKNRYGLSAPGNVWGSLIDDDGKDVYHVPLSFGLSQGMNKYLDLSNTYIGDKKVNPAELLNIAYENAKIAAVWLPVNADGDIDWQGFKAYSMAEKEIHDKHITDPKTKAEIHGNKGSYITYNSKGEQIPLRQVERFFMTHGYTSGNIVGDSVLNVELTGDAEKAAEDTIDAIYNKNIGKVTGINGIRGKHFWNNIYVTPIFIKASKNASIDARVAAGHGPMDKPHTIQDFKIKLEMLRAPESKIIASSNLLFEQ